MNAKIRTKISLLTAAVAATSLFSSALRAQEVSVVPADEAAETFRLAAAPAPADKKALLVYGFLEGATTLAPGDAAVRNRLENQGYVVRLKEASKSQASDAVGMDLVLISSTIDSGAVNSKFRDVSVPVIVWEHAVFDDMMLTGPTYWTDFGYDENDPGLLTIVDATHPLSAGLSGNVKVIGSANGIRWSDVIVWATTPSRNATKIAVHAGEPNKVAASAYETEAAMVGMNAPARRAGFHFYRNTPAITTDAGWALFDALTAWVTDRRFHTDP